MLYMNIRKPSTLVEVNVEFNKLTYGDIKPYMGFLKENQGFFVIVNNPTNSVNVRHIVIQTRFGECMLSDISTSLKIMILAKIAIKQKKHICFVAGELGDNFVEALYDLCKDTDYVSLYQKNGILPQLSASVKYKIKCR